MLPLFIARQLSQPAGMLGHLVARLMNRVNAGMNACVLEQLEIAPTDRVLEVGFGGGVALRPLLATGAYVAGVDPSPAMVARANATFAGAVGAGRAEFRLGSVDALPFAAASFGKASTVNTIYFWPSLGAGLAELHRVLMPGGRLAVGFTPKEWMTEFPPAIFTSRTPAEVIAALTDAGFHDVCVARPEASTRWTVIIANR